MSSAESEMPVFPWHRSCPYQPPAQYAQLRPEKPIAKVMLATGREAWVVTSHKLVKQLLADPRASSDRAHEGFPYYIPIPSQFRTEASFIGLDPPEHTVHRRLAAVSGEFTKLKVQAMRPRIQEIVDERIDAMLAAGPPVDLVSMLALPVPLTVVSEVLGVPPQDHDYLHAQTDTLFGGRSTGEERGQALLAMNAYIGEVVEDKLANPTDDLLSRIIVGYRDAGMYDKRTVTNVIRLLLNGGHETSAAMIALGTLTLLQHPDQLEIFRSDPAIVPGAVEELLRYITPGDLASSRVALDDIEVGGVTIRKGEGMVILGYAANRDPEAFADPDVLDVTRGERHHVAFGYGVHHCIGSEIARAELQIVLSTLFRRIPDIQLAKPWEELRYKDGNVMYGVYEMPVTW